MSSIFYIIWQKIGLPIESDPLYPHASRFFAASQENSPLANDKLAPKRRLALGSTDGCQALHYEGDICERLCGCLDAMVPIVGTAIALCCNYMRFDLH
jgi:hypothetical protein